MLIFDGVNSINTMEYERLDVDKISVGMLLYINPGLEVRRGVIFLKKSFVEVVYTPSED